MLVITIDDIIFGIILGLFILGIIVVLIMAKIEDLKDRFKKRQNRKVKEE